MRLDRCLIVVLAAALAVGCAGGVSRNRAKQNNEATRAAALQVELAQGYIAQNDLETANAKLERALDLDPVSVDAHTLVGVLNERIGRFDVAEQHYRRAVALKPDGGAVNNNLGAFLCGQGRAEEAVAFFETAFRDPFYKTPAMVYGNAGVCAAKRGDNESAERYFRKALDFDRNNLSALFALSKMSLARGDKLRARAFVQRYEAIAPLDAELLDLAARIEEANGDSDTAADYRKKLETDYPDYAKARSEGSSDHE